MKQNNESNTHPVNISHHQSNVDFSSHTNLGEQNMSFDDLLIDLLEGDLIPNSLHQEEDEEEALEQHSSSTPPDVQIHSIETTSSTGKKKARVDRSLTLISERMRRGRMKEKLYALRALVPTITKMDKASIVGDAVLYIQDLHTQIENLKAEISDLEATPLKLYADDHSANKISELELTTTPLSNANDGACKMVMTITQMDMVQLNQREYYIKLSTSNKQKGTAVALYRAIESLRKELVVQKSDLASDDTFVLTFTIDIGNKPPDEVLLLDPPSLKQRIVASFLNQGFHFNMF